MKRAGTSIAGRLALAAALALAVSACKSNNGTQSTPAASAVEHTSSALTAITRTGWVLSTCTTAATCGGTLANATDGNTATAWTTAKVQTSVQPFNAATTQFFKVDMLTSQSFVGIGLDAGTNVNNFPHTYSVAVSTNDTTYTTVATGTGTTPLVNVAFGAQTARYIKVSITATATVPWSVAELNVYGTALPRTGWALSASPAGTTIANAIDGSATTKWSSGANQASGQFFQIDMLDLKSINKITLDAGTSTGEYPRAFQVLVSKDGQSSTFTNVAATGTGSTQLVTISFPSVEARFIRVALTGAATNFWSIYEINVFGSSTPTTALPRVGWATAAGTTSNPDPGGNGSVRANALDGSLTSRWTTGAAQATTQFFQVDMLMPQSFTQVVLDSGSGSTTDYPRGYQVSVSNDATNWTSVATGTGTAEITTVTFPLQNARYIKVSITQPFAGNWWSIAEFNVYGPALARNGWVATSSTALSGTNYQSNAIDGSATTRWQNGVTQAAGQFFQLDMGAPETFTGLTVDAGTSTGLYPRGYQVSVSNDGTNWGSAIATGTGTTELLAIPFPIQTARYVRIALTGTGQTTQWAIQELNVWRGCGSGTCVAPDQCHNAVCDPILIVCTTPQKANNTPCPNNTVCDGNETCQTGVCQAGTPPTVDDGNPCTVDECDPVSGVSHTPGNAGTVCRQETTGGCDVAETCTGTSTTCPTDGFAPSGTSCRTAAGECDVAEVCPGNSANCPTGTRRSRRPRRARTTATCARRTSATERTWRVSTPRAMQARYVARRPRGGCDVAETCTGTSTTCPTDGFAPSGTSCRTAAGECDVTEVCPGNSANCPTDAKKPANTACTDDGNVCTTDKCDGTNVACQHAAGNAGTVCRAATSGGCDVAEACTGSSTTCPTDGFAPSGTSCRAVAGECDVAEVCPGSSANCPADAKKPVNTACTDDGSVCTTDLCDGANVTCQHAAGNAGTVCRTAAGDCDVAEVCTGSSTTCPTDAKKPANTACTDDGNVCTTDLCDGTNVGCQHAAGNSGTVCHASAGACDVAETCDGASTTCPNDTFAPASTICRAATGQCDLAESCEGNSAACPSDQTKPNGSSCDDGSACTTNDTCQSGACTSGSGTTCPAPNQCQVAGVCNPAALPAPPSNGLVGLWHLDGDTNDSSGNGLNLTNNGAQVTGGVSGKAYDFDGTACLSIPEGSTPLSLTGGTGVTMMAWVRTAASYDCPTTLPRVIMGKGYDYSLASHCDDPGTPVLTGETHPAGNPAVGFPGGAGDLTKGSWTMVAVTSDGNSIREYINGHFGIAYGNPGQLDHLFHTFAIGCANLSDIPSLPALGGFVGSIDEVSLYSRPLTDAEIAAYYAATINPCTYTPKTDGTTCNDGNACTLTDTCQGGSCAGGAAGRLQSARSVSRRGDLRCRDRPVLEPRASRRQPLQRRQRLHGERDLPRGSLRRRHRPERFLPVDGAVQARHLRPERYSNAARERSRRLVALRRRHARFWPQRA